VEVTSHQRRAAAREQAVGLRHAQPRQLDHVLEILRRQQGECGALALDDGVDADRRAMDEALDIGRADAVPLLQEVEAAQQLGPRSLRRGQHLEAVQLFLRLVPQAEIDEGAADIHANAHAHVDKELL
jgi:hypothetical protein